MPSPTSKEFQAALDLIGGGFDDAALAEVEAELRASRRLVRVRPLTLPLTRVPLRPPALTRTEGDRPAAPVTGGLMT